MNDNETPDDFESPEGSNNNFSWIGVIIFIIIAYFVFKWVGGLGKYEGQSAEEWFNEYDAENARYEELHDCVETYYENPNDLYYNCL